MIEPAEVFTFFFVTLGPLKVLGPFAERTRDIDDATTRQIAVRAFAVATVAVIVGGFLGRAHLAHWHVPIPALMLAGGIVFFLVALIRLLQQYEPPRRAPEALPKAPTAAALRLVFPIVLTPYGVAILIVLMAASPSAERMATIIALLLLVMVLNLLAMLYARRILVGFTIIVLQVLEALLAVMQVALSIEFILAGLRGLDVVAR
jgi:small neutral amino acid transporter SnatA (MarC family)